jgi:hypothetical protein
VEWVSLDFEKADLGGVGLGEGGVDGDEDEAGPVAFDELGGVAVGGEAFGRRKVNVAQVFDFGSGSSDLK